MTTKKVYTFSLVLVLFASIYPMYMGISMVISYIQKGGVNFNDYPSYIIPYTPICISLILCIALLPFIYKLCKRFALLVVSALGTVLLLVSENVFENLVVFVEKTEIVTVEGWQLAMCIAPLPIEIPMEEVKYYVAETLGLQYNSLFKVHFYAIALLIIISVIGLVYGFYRMAETQVYSKQKPLIAQLICVVGFIGLCILACFTAFFRTGNMNIPPISAVLMTVFFFVFGITAGVYSGTWLYGKQKVVSVIIPSVVAMLMTIVMYIGEMVMLDWQLFRFGTGFLFDGLGLIPFSPFDILTVLFSSITTFLILTMIKPKERIE